MWIRSYSLVCVAVAFAAAAFSQSAPAETRAFDQSCKTVFPAAVQYMAGHGFEPKVSDAAGGILTLQYSGEPMVMAFMVKHAKPFLAKYVQGGDKMRSVQGLTYTGATMTFTADDGCRVRLAVTISAIDTKPNTYRKPGEPSWVRVYKPVMSNGTAEKELLLQFDPK